MKKNYLMVILLLLCVGFMYADQLELTGSAYGADSNPTEVTIDITGLPAGATITDLLVTTVWGNSTYIGSWYDVHLEINETSYPSVGLLTDQSYSDINGTVLTGHSVRAYTEDLDDYADSSTLYLTVKVEYTPAAGTPEAPILTLPADGALNQEITGSLEWTIGADTDTATLYIADNADFTDADMYAAATSPYAYSGLDLNTMYYWKVVAINNGSGIESQSSVYSFATEYGTATVPYTENFDSYDDGDLPDGWSIFNNSGSAYTYTEVETGYSVSGSNSFRMYNSSYTSSDIIASTPRMQTNGNRVKFSAKGSSDGTILYVGTMTDPLDNTTFTRLDSISLTTTHTIYTVNLSDVDAVDYVSFKHGHGSTYSYIYLDDVLVEEAPQGTQITISPEEADCGHYLQGATIADSVMVTVSNTGGTTATITEISVADLNNFAVSYTFAVPYELEAGSSFDVYVKTKSDYVGTHESNLVIKEQDPANPIVPIIHNATILSQILDSTGNDHNDPFVLTIADSIFAEGNSSAYDDNYDFDSSASVVYKLTLAQDKLMIISFEGSSFDTKMWVFNSFDQIDTATQNSDAWYYNDDESGSGTGGRFVEGPKTRDRATWSRMDQTLAGAGDYYIVLAGYGTASGDYQLHVMLEDIPAPMQATNPSPEDDAIDQATSLTLEWTNAQWTSMNDIYFGTVGNMTLLDENIDVTEEYLVENLSPTTEYEWKVVCKNLNGQTPADSVATWSFTTVGQAPEAAQYLSPDSLGTDVSLSGSLTWEAATGADGYYVYLSTDEFFSGVTPEDVNTNSYAYTNLDYDTRYFWKVVPYNVVGSPTEGIEVWQFETMASPFPEADIVFDGERSTGQSMPIEPYFGYTMTQNIYAQEEINVSDSAINSISYLYNNNSAWSETIEIYAKHTTKDTFADTYDWDLNGFTQVYSGTMTVDTTNPIVTIDFDTPFIYNNTDNLLIMFFATESGYNSGSDEFYNYSVEGNRSLNIYSDGTNYSTTFPTTVPAGTLKSYIPVTGFNIQEVSAESEFTASADTLTFEDQVMGTVSDSQTLTISNIGLGDLVISSVELVGSNAVEYDFTDLNTYPDTLSTSEVLNFAVVYSPETEGDHLATIEITDSEATVYTVEIVGNSVDTNIYAEDLPFSNSGEDDNSFLGWYSSVQSTSEYAAISINGTETNAHTGTNSVRFYNSGDTAAEMMLTSPVIVPDFTGHRAKFWIKGDTAGQLIFALYDADMQILTAIDTVDVPLTYTQFIYEFDTSMDNKRLVFKPIFGGTYDNVYLDDVEFEVTPQVPVADISVTELAFGEIEVGETSGAQTITVSNVGIGEMIVSNIEITGTDAALFAFDNVVLPDTLMDNEMLDINVTFSPDAVGPKTATLVISDNLNRASYNVTLTGDGWVPPTGSTCVDPLALTLPAVDVTGTTEGFVDDYSSAGLDMYSSYLDGDDIVYQFTLEQGALLNGTATTSDVALGLFIVQDEPNTTTPVEVFVYENAGYNGTSVTLTDEYLAAGDYYLIISSYGYYAQSIDFTLNLTADAIPAPEAATNPTPADEAIDQPTALTLEWTNAEYTETVDLYFGTSRGRSMSLVLDNVAAVEEYAVTDLTPNTEYSWKVVNRNYTGETVDTLVTTWTFTTIGSAPEAVTYTSPTDESTDKELNGTLSWQAATGANGYNVYLDTDSTFTSVTPIDQTATSYDYSGLDYSTTYYWKVVPYNVVGTPTEGVEIWSFTTMEDPTIAMPVTIDFEGSTTNPVEITEENFGITNGHNTITNAMYKNIYSSSTNGYIQFQAMNGITSSSVIEFDYRVTLWSAGTTGVTFEDDHDYIVVNASTDAGATFTPIASINNTNHTNTADFTRLSVDISAYEGQSVVFRLEMFDDTVNDMWFDFDNFYFGEPVITQPDAPVDFAIVEIATGLELTWTAVEGATTYKVYGCATPDGEYTMMTEGQVVEASYVYTEDAPMMFFKVYASPDAMPLGKTIRRARRN